MATARTAELTTLGDGIYSLDLTPSTVYGGETSAGMLTLLHPAPSGGWTVHLSSSLPSYASGASSITIPAGDTSATFSIPTKAYSRTLTFNITARDQTTSRVRPLTSLVNGFSHVFSFSQPSDTIEFTGGTLDGTCNLGSNFTIEMFLRPTSTDGDIWRQWTDGSMSEQIILTGGKFETLSTGTTAILIYTFEGASVPLNKWTHLAWCYDGTNVRLYQDGKLTLEVATPTRFDPIVPGQSCSLGANAAYGEEGFGQLTGDIAGFRVSNVDRYTGTSFIAPTGPFHFDSSTLLSVDPSRFMSTPTIFTTLGSQGITAFLGQNGTPPAWLPYTP